MQPHRHPMHDPNAMMVRGDHLLEQGDVRGYDWQSVSMILRQIHDLIPGVEVLPSGSRFYGAYYTPYSDWDFYAKVDFYKYGWYTSGWTCEGSEPDHFDQIDPDRSGWRSYRKGVVNLILFTSQAQYDCFHRATMECLAKTPATKAKAVEIFQSHLPVPRTITNADIFDAIS